MVGLLDVNVLVALLVPTHVHHQDARGWVLNQGIRTGWATCPVTELGAIRVCAQLAVGARMPEATADALIQMRIANRGHLWWPDAVSPAVVSEVRRAQTARQVTDRYLLGLARRYGGQLVTFDQGIVQVGGPILSQFEPVRALAAANRRAETSSMTTASYLKRRIDELNQGPSRPAP